MFYRYDIKNNGNEDILYLYLDMKNEFAKDNTDINNDLDLTRKAKNYIVNNDIKFKGKKVFLIIDGIVVKSLDISKIDVNYQNNPSFSNEEFLINIKMNDSSYIQVSLRRYLLGILANIYNSVLELETLKCIAILYRTYAYKMMKEENCIDSNNSFFKYDDITSYKIKWINDYDVIYERIENAVDDTDCIFASYNNEYILPFIHFSNNGFTFNSHIPYLESVSSLWDLCNPNDKEILDYSYNSISKILGVNINKKSKIDIVDVDDNSQIIRISINDKLFTGEELKQLLSLKSLNFNIILYKNVFRVITFGDGNSLGLSIYGANELAIDGLLYPDILKYYFPSVKLNKYIKELP